MNLTPDWADYLARNARARLEYRLLPTTTGRSITAPCIRRCGRVATTHRGICRACLKGES